MIKRATKAEDDGHTSKFIRALIQGQRASQEFEEKDNFLIKGDMWRTIAQMCELSHLPATRRHKVRSFGGSRLGSANIFIGLDSVVGVDARWVRIAGFPEAWEMFEDRT